MIHIGGDADQVLIQATSHNYRVVGLMKVKSFKHQ